ncbi:hypothetical protein Ae201684P_018702 [Aphanomyces euteiches]|uniref:Secreted protein n=1 Tax=Aphanomyces euteiches TaxID=100861 RepID=A0A6G0XWD9_9STRA|nr:hypothetical protein Ae201684_000729 [Aphanomyces euteiches]KAH9099689.1 hypothetical protein Ae201684P_018702 [Aphanomyces euteiches]
MHVAPWLAATIRELALLALRHSFSSLAVAIEPPRGRSLDNIRLSSRDRSLPRAAWRGVGLREDHAQEKKTGKEEKRGSHCGCLRVNFAMNSLADQVALHNPQARFIIWAV